MLTEAILLDISQAERQIRELERELDRLNEPVRVPVDIEGERAADELRRDFSNADVAVADLNAELAETDRELDQVRNSANRAGRELEETGRRGTTSFNGMAVAAGAFGVALAAAVGVRAFIGFAGQAIDAASDFEESLSKSQVVFGEFAGDIEQFARTGPQALGLANREALAFTATFGNLFVALGLSQEAAAELSPEIVQLGADLASFNNIDVADALEKLRSGLVGEAEPLRALGVNINETVTKAKALELGLGNMTGELTEAEKVQARYALIVEQTATAQGDFARTADGIANTQRSLNAEWENAKAAIGEALLPAFQALLDVAPQLIDGLEGLVPVIQNIANNIASADWVSFVNTLVDIGRALSTIPQNFSLNPFDTDLEDAQAVSKLTQGFIEELRKGEDPAKTLLNTLVQLTTKKLDPEGFKEAADAFIEMAGLDPRRTLDVLRELRTSGTDLGLTADVIAQVAEALALVEDVSGGRRGRGGAGLASGIEEINVAAEEVIQPVSAATAEILALSQAGESLEDFAPDLGAEGFVNNLDAMTTAMSGAAEALRDKEGEIVDDLDTFLKQLSDVFEDQLDFARNISILRTRGLDELADVFEEAGLEAATALADAVADPGAAAKANQAIADQGAALAQAQFAAFDTEIKQLIAGYEPDAVVIPLTFGGLPDIPISAITAGAVVPIPGRAGATEITTNIIVDSNEELPSAASRAVQIINTGVNASRSGPS